MAKKILLVDDEPLILKGLKYTLEQEGYETDSAMDGEEALAKFFAQTYDIILRAARFNEYGEISENGRMTVIHNGIVVHNNVELPHVTPDGITNNKRVARGPLMLQDHRSAVSYRNIWVMNLDHYN